MICPLAKVQAQKLAFNIEKLMKTKDSLEMQVHCDFKTAEVARNELEQKGFRVLLFSEFKQLCIGVWK